MTNGYCAIVGSHVLSAKFFTAFANADEIEDNQEQKLSHITPMAKIPTLIWGTGSWSDTDSAILKKLAISFFSILGKTAIAAE